jgi:hypothetical protein
VTLSRRQFSFASIAAMFGTAAHAAGPSDNRAVGQAPTIPELDAPTNIVVPGYESDGGSPVVITPVLVRSGQALELTVTVRNLAAKRGQVSILTHMGSNPVGAPRLVAMVGGVTQELQQAPAQVDRRQLMSRMGPVPRYRALAAGEAVELGPYRFDLPKGATPPGEVSGEVHVSFAQPADGQSGAVPFVRSGLTWGSKAS